MAYSTAGSIINSAWNILRTQGSTTDIPALQESSMLTYLNQANMEWLRAFRRGAGVGPQLFQRETGFTLAADTAINQTTLLSSATSFIVDDLSNFDTTNGSGVIWSSNMPDIFYYTTATVSTETLAGVTGLAFTHSDEDAVQKLYKLPTDFKDFRSSQLYGDGVQYNGIPLRYMNGPPIYGYFSTIDDGTNKWLWLPRQSTGTASVLYEKNSASITTISDTVDVEPQSEFFLVYRIVQWASIPKSGGQPSNLYTVAKAEANRILKESLDDNNVGNVVRTRPIRLLKPYRDPSLWIPVPR